MKGFPSTPGRPGRRPPPARPSLLLIDDEVALGRTFARTFANSYLVQTASSGPAGLALLREASVDVVIVDFSMPGMSGVEVLNKVARDHPRVARLMMTAYADLPEVMELKAIQLVAAVISKPWEPEEVHQAVGKALRLASMQRAVAQMKDRFSPD